ncbi:hypothetical protein Plhal304r1_c017g0061081 [Plasmopara halstedii]
MGQRLKFVGAGVVRFRLVGGTSVTLTDVLHVRSLTANWCLYLMSWQRNGGAAPN